MADKKIGTDLFENRSRNFMVHETGVGMIEHFDFGTGTCLCIEFRMVKVVVEDFCQKGMMGLCIHDHAPFSAFQRTSKPVAAAI